MHFDAYIGYIYLIGIFLAIAILYLLIARTKALKEARKLLEEKEEKIQWLRRIHGENEYKLNRRIQELEKSLTQAEHTVDTLERKLQEGTKNQVVSKLEALQRKRDQALKEAGLES